MMHLFVNSLAATAGGGLTYIRNVLPHLAAAADLKVTIALPSSLRAEFSFSDPVDFLEMSVPVARRFFFEQSELPGLIERAQSDVLLSTGNFALRRSPVPQILLSRNSIYTSLDYYRDLRSRHEYRKWLDTRMRSILAKRSIAWADLTVAPSEAFAKELRRWTGKDVMAIHHGFDYEAFTRAPDPPSAEIEVKLKATEGCLTLLFVSHYNYYRNFETLIRALPLLRDRFTGTQVRLLLTCSLSARQNASGYHSESAANLVKKLCVSDMVIELGSLPYQQLHYVYAHADAYVTPAYTETFAHPLVEAMANGVPVIASDLAVHREICGNAATYFPPFCPRALAEAVAGILSSNQTATEMVAAGLERSKEFSWRTHVNKIIALCHRLVDSRNAAKSVIVPETGEDVRARSA